MRKSTAPVPEKPRSFEQSLDELEVVVKQLETSELPLDKALDLFERGVNLSDSCRKQLTDAEARIEKLVKKGESILPIPFEPEDE